MVKALTGIPNPILSVKSVKISIISGNCCLKGPIPFSLLGSTAAWASAASISNVPFKALMSDTFWIAYGTSISYML
jgi:hypothetical protein